MTFAPASTSTSLVTSASSSSSEAGRSAKAGTAAIRLVSTTPSCHRTTENLVGLEWARHLSYRVTFPHTGPGERRRCALVRLLDQSVKFRCDHSPQCSVLLVGVGKLRIVPHVLRVARDRAGDLVRRFPVVAGMDVSVQDRLGVAKHLIVDPPKTAVPTRALNGLAEQREVEEELLAALPVQVGEVVDGRVVGEE